MWKNVQSCEQDGCDKGIVGRWPMISAISNLSSSRANSTAPKSSEFQPGRAGPAPAFLAYAQIFVRPHQTGRPSVPSRVEVGGGGGEPHLELGSPARLLSSSGETVGNSPKSRCSLVGESTIGTGAVVLILFAQIRKNQEIPKLQIQNKTGS